MNVRHLFVVGTAAALLSATLAGSSASAKSGTAESGWSGHCVAQLAVGGSRTPAMTCYRTFTDAIRIATGGAVTDAPASPSGATAAALARRITTANAAAAARTGTRAAPQLLVGIEYSEPNYAGGTITAFQDTACTAANKKDAEYSLDLPKSLWDQISSYQTFNQCWADHYYLAGFKGAHTGYTPGKPTMDAMAIDGGPYPGDNNTRSILWS